MAAALSLPQSSRLWRDIAELVLSDAALLVFFVVTWISPFAIEPRAPYACMAIMMMEFISIHSTGFLVVFSGTRVVWLTVLIYVPFVLAAAFFSKAVWPLVMFAWHVYGTVSAFRGNDPSRKREAIVRWVICFVLFMLCVGLAMIPWPALGWGEATTPDLAWSSDSGETAYHITPAWGTLYFLALTVVDALILKKRYSGSAEAMEEDT